MSDAPQYQLIGPAVQTQQYDPATGQTQQGYKQQVKWLPTGTIFSIFIPQDSDYAATAAQLIAFEGKQLDQLAALGRQ